MPLYEYTCENCLERMELLIRAAEKPVCPKCGSKKLHKEFSTFAARGEGGYTAGSGHSHGSGCGCCGGGSGGGACGMN